MTTLVSLPNRTPCGGRRIDCDKACSFYRLLEAMEYLGMPIPLSSLTRTQGIEIADNLTERQADALAYLALDWHEAKPYAFKSPPLEWVEEWRKDYGF